METHTQMCQHLQIFSIEHFLNSACPFLLLQGHYPAQCSFKHNETHRSQVIKALDSTGNFHSGVLEQVEAKLCNMSALQGAELDSSAQHAVLGVHALLAVLLLTPSFSLSVNYRYDKNIKV